MNAVDHNWRDGRPGLEDDSDLRFVREILELYKPMGFDKVLAVGFSNGAMFVQRLACEARGGVTHFASISGALPEDLRCSPPDRRNVLMINGTDDSIVKWAGGEIPRSSVQGRGGRTLSVPDTAAFWKRHNRCSEPLGERLDSADDGTATEKIVFACERGSSLRLYRVEGGGHTLPGSQGSGRSPFSSVIGKTGQDFSAEAEIFRFLDENP